MANAYLEKHKFLDPVINVIPPKDLQMVVVIPCFNEPDLIATLDSLRNCARTKSSVEIIVVINSGEHADETILRQNEKTFHEATGWIQKHQGEKLKFHLLRTPNLPMKHAGVGLARKIGMDESVARFEAVKNPEGVLVCLDADCAMDKNYLVALENHFEKNPKVTGCSIYFEHPVEGNKFDERTYEGIINYELFLRCYHLSLAACGFPHSFHTIGSCMAVRNFVYQKQGGMNKRKAGEDFYFLHKIFPLGNFTVLNGTRVIPSPRISDRVPFGTGSAMGKWSNNISGEYFFYHPQAFSDLQLLFKTVPELFLKKSELIFSYLSPALQSFLIKNNFENNLTEIRANCASQEMFEKRFFNWFDGFKVLKFVHFAGDHFYSQMEITEAVKILLQKNYSYSTETMTTKKELLQELRAIERSGSTVFQPVSA